MGLLLCYWKFVKGAQIFTEDGPLALLAPVLKLTGIHFLAIGLVSEILTRTYFELQNKRIYCVRKVCRQGLSDKVAGSGKFKVKRYIKLFDEVLLNSGFNQ